MDFSILRNPRYSIYFEIFPLLRQICQLLVNLVFSDAAQDRPATAGWANCLVAPLKVYICLFAANEPFGATNKPKTVTIVNRTDTILEYKASIIAVLLRLTVI